MNTNLTILDFLGLCVSSHKLRVVAQMRNTTNLDTNPYQIGTDVANIEEAEILIESHKKQVLLSKIVMSKPIMLTMMSASA